MKKYAIVIEKGPRSNCSAYVPDLPGCVAAAASLEPTTEVDYAEVAAA